MKTYFHFLVLFIFSISVFSQNSIIYIDEFEKKLTEEEFNQLEGVNESYIFNNYVKVIKYNQYSGIVSDSMRARIIEFLNTKSSKSILNADTIIINAGIMEGNCNISNMPSYKNYLQKINDLNNIKYFELISKKSKKYKEQLVDDSLLIYDNFFKYYKWNIKRIEKCGGTLIIYPNNKFFRIAGDGNSHTIFDVLKNNSID